MIHTPDRFPVEFYFFAHATPGSDAAMNTIEQSEWKTLPALTEPIKLRVRFALL